MTHKKINIASTLPTIATRPHALPADPRGFTFLELMLVMTILSVLTLMAIPVYNGVQTTAKTARAETEIRDIEKAIYTFSIDNNKYPDSLDDVNRGTSKDPWGRGYHYTNIDKGGAPRMGVPEYHEQLNHDFDLFSTGPDGDFAINDITADTSVDDIVRAGDGSFVGTGAQY